MPVRDIVAAIFAEVAREQGRKLPPLTDESRLFGLDLDSLCLAIIVARLDDALRADPFSADDVPIPATFGEFVALYRNVPA